jgi:hypothetical protein
MIYIISKILIYILIGMVWKDWLEYYTNKHFEGRMGERFTLRETLTQVFLWPVFVLIFITEFIRNIL